MNISDHNKSYDYKIKSRPGRIFGNCNDLAQSQPIINSRRRTHSITVENLGEIRVKNVENRNDTDSEDVKELIKVMSGEPSQRSLNNKAQPSFKTKDLRKPIDDSSSSDGFSAINVLNQDVGFIAIGDQYQSQMV